MPSIDAGAAHGGAPDLAARAEQFLRQGEPLLAANLVQEGLERTPGHVRLRQLQGLALARSGDIGRANAILAALAAEGRADAETLGMLARTHKDLAARASDGARRALHFNAAFDLYAKAFEDACGAGALAEAYYAGINAAAVAVLLGDADRGRTIAREVRDICRRDAERPSAAPDYWREATLGEAALILGDAHAAGTHYAAAARIAGNRHGDIGSTRRQARLLAASLPGTDPAAFAALRIAPVVVFTGCMIDQPGRARARFPAAIEPRVRAALRERLEAVAPAAVYGSAACGADLLVLELARELGAETHIVLPFPPADFRRESVDFAGGHWGERFERALAHAESVTVASDHHASGSVATFEYANLLVTGMGRLRAQVLDTRLQAVAAWDPGAPGAAGGAASLVAHWRQRGIDVQEIALGPLRSPGEALPAPAPAMAPEAQATHAMRAMLFADAVGYSKLSEDQIPRYVSEFLGAIAALCRRTAHRFEHVEVAGDGLYMVFQDTADAGHFALELGALASGTDWGALGLPGNLDLRIALHCGPVYCGIEPITGSRIYTGPHTSRTARIEPITPPGQVYASAAFAAVAAASGVDDLALGYVGRMPLAKGAGHLALYHVKHA